MTLALCLAASGILGATVGAEDFTLAWIHSIEKIRWEEDYRLTPAGFELVAARIRGAGAGMEPPAGARLRDGVWHYRPQLARLARLSLARSPAVADYELCLAGRCRPLGDYLDARSRAQTYVELYPCEQP